MKRKTSLKTTSKPNEILYQGIKIGELTVLEIKDCQIRATYRLTHCYSCGKHLIHAPGIGLYCPNRKCDVLDGVGRFLLTETL